MTDSGRLDCSARIVGQNEAYVVKMRCRKGLEDAGGRGRYGTKLNRSCWNSEGIPGNTHSWSNAVSFALTQVMLRCYIYFTC